MLALLPIAAYFGVVAVLITRTHPRDVRMPLLRGSVLWGAIVVVLTEGLSLFQQLSRASLALAWCVLLLGMTAWLIVRRADVRRAFHDLEFSRLQRGDRLLVVSVGIAIGLILVVAWLAPPNTWDALSTHMTRVAHWASQRSIRHFATGIELQNYYPPFPAMSILQTYILLPGDGLANLSQWFSMVLSIVGVSLLASQLGATRSGQVFAVVFAASLPAGISQASGTMTDYVASLWTIAMAHEVLTLSKGKVDWRESGLFLGLAAGLAINSKPTVIPVVIALVGYLAIDSLRNKGLLVSLRVGLLALLMVALINTGYFGRNILTYGSPIGGNAGIEAHANEAPLWKVLISNSLRNASLHMGTPNPYVNKAIFLAIKGIHDAIGIGVSDPNTSMHSAYKIQEPSRHESKAANPLHFYLLIGLGAAAAYRRRLRSGILAWTLMLLAAFILFAVLFQFSMFGARYHLALFLLISPAAAMWAESILGRPWMKGVSALLLLAAIPWLFAVESRPLVPLPGDAPSVLTADRQQLMFAYAPGLEDTYSGLLARVKGAACENLAVSLEGSSAEYPIWAMMGAPKSNIRIRWLVAGTASARYIEPGYSPCAILCEDCGAQERMRGLPLVEQRAGFSLFLKER
ncbi:MAG: glycosyltransferase family 39 protein [Anaerolineales bacterium]